MSEPRRILDEDSGLGAQVLRSAMSDAPAPGARHKSLAAFGLAAGTTAGAAHAAAGLAGSKATASLPILMMAKWTAIGVAGGVMVLGGASALRGTHASSSEAELRQRSLVVNVVASQPRVVVEQPAESASTPATSSSPDPVLSRVVPRSSVSAVEPLPSLAAETALIDEARRALMAHDSQAAVFSLDRHDAEFPRGSLGIEASVLRIESLVQRGDQATAERHARRFVAAHPISPVCRRVRALVGLKEDEIEADPGVAEPSAP